MKSIETRYKAHSFRSRLEARWAVFFDKMGIRWDYEPEGYELGRGARYLPDFFIHWPSTDRREGYQNAGYWVEIKGQTPTGSDLGKLISLAQGTQHHAYLLQGDPGSFNYWAASCSATPRLHEGRVATPEQLWLQIAPIATCAAKGANLETVREAIQAARSARFEFGEVPK